MGMRQPQTSKHLRVLKQVGVVTIRNARQQRLYRLNPIALKPIYDFVSLFEALWRDRLNRLSGYLDSLQVESTQGES